MKQVNIELISNPKQAEFFITSLAAAQRKNAYKFLHYGGAIRGGKTFVTLAILIRLCEIFPRSRWHIIRKDFPSLQKNTIPSFEKIVLGSQNWKFNRASSNYYAYNRKGSRIYFISENISRDPFLNSFLGFETNGFFLEQVEELSEKVWQKAIERLGSWYLPKMPRGLIFTTFNPTQTWIKEKVYEPYIENKLPPDTFFMRALPTDSKYVSEDQYTGWKSLSERYYKQFIEGDWTDFDGAEGRWLFAFSENKNVANVEWLPNEITHLSFDFNRNPIVCSAWQYVDDVIRCPRVIKLKDSTIYRLCQQIEQCFPNAIFFVTGDASGAVPTTISNLNNFEVIKNYFRLSQNQMKVSRSNPRLEFSRMFCNTMFEQVNILIDKENAAPLIYDAKNVKAKSDNTIVKDNRNIESQQADTLDTMRYAFHAFFKDFVRTIES